MSYNSINSLKKMYKKIEGGRIMNFDLFFVWLFIIAQIVIALFYCFWGYRFFRVILSLYVFIFVFPLAYSGISGFSTISQPIALLIAVVIALLAGLLAWFIYKLAIFLAGGILGILIAFWLYQLLGSSYMILCIILGIVLFILLGILAVKFQKVVIVLISSVIGAFNLVIYGLFLFMHYAEVNSFSILNLNGITSTISATYQAQPLWLIPTVILAIAGILVQFLLTARGRD